jgi:hypothetical protein
MGFELSPKAQAALLLDDRGRIDFIHSGRWIAYSAAQSALEILDDLLHHPRVHRMPNMLLVSETNNGKTAIIRHFHDTVTPPIDPAAEVTVTPVMLIEAPPVPDERRLLSLILDSLNAPYKRNDRADNLARELKRLAPKLGVRMLIIDEIHHVLAGDTRKQQSFLNVIKHLGNVLQIPIVAAGTREAFNALRTDEQLANRFKPFALPRWEFNLDYQRFLVSYEHMLPLRKESKLADEALARKILRMAGGTVGEISELLRTASIAAIKTKEEHISSKVLDGLTWTPASERTQTQMRKL